MEQIKEGVFQGNLVLNEEENRIVDDWLLQRKYDNQIDKRGSMCHKKLVYDTIYFFLKLGYTIGEMRHNHDGDLVLTRHGFFCKYQKGSYCA